MQYSVIFVCRANVCRSPLMAAVFAREVASRGLWEVSSAGTHATSPLGMCRAAIRVAGGDDELGGRVAVQLTPERIHEADLVITASVGERGSVALLDPFARAKTFTLLEAVDLAETDMSSAEYARHAGNTVAALLHSRRGRVKPGATRRRGAGIDIADGHTAGPMRHFLTLRTTSGAARDLAGRVGSLVGQLSV